MFRVCHALLSAHCSIVVTCLERTGLLALLYVMFSCVFVTFQCGVLGQVWYLIVSIPDLLTYFLTLTRNTEKSILAYFLSKRQSELQCTACDKVHRYATR